MASKRKAVREAMANEASHGIDDEKSKEFDEIKYLQEMEMLLRDDESHGISIDDFQRVMDLQGKYGVRQQKFSVTLGYVDVYPPSPLGPQRPLLFTSTDFEPLETGPSRNWEDAEPKLPPRGLAQVEQKAKELKIIPTDGAILWIGPPPENRVDRTNGDRNNSDNGSRSTELRIAKGLVTLDQCAAIVRKAKRTLERWKTNDREFPDPQIDDGGGSPHYWEWSEMREYLKEKTGLELPEDFPSSH